MSKIDGLAGVSIIARLFAGNIVYRRVVTHLAAALLFTVITAMLAGALLIGACYATYLALIHYGIEADTSILIVSAIISASIVCCAFLTLYFVRKLRDAIIPIPAMPRVRRVIQAFADGFNEG